MCLLSQRRISPLYPDTGLQVLLGRPIPIKTNLNMIQTPPYYRDATLNDVPSQYAEKMETFRILLNSLTPGTLPRTATAVMGLDVEKGTQELRPRGPSSMLPLNSFIKDAFDKFDKDSQLQTWLRESTSSSSIHS